MFLLSAFVLGFLGSFHCIGMCGPIALMLPEKQGSKLRIILGKIYYNLGRLATYSVLGCITGLIGFGFSIKGLQIQLSIFSAIFILIFSLINLLELKPRKSVSLYSGIYSSIR